MERLRTKVEPLLTYSTVDFVARISEDCVTKNGLFNTRRGVELFIRERSAVGAILLPKVEKLVKID